MSVHDTVSAALTALGLPFGHLTYKVGTGETLPATYLTYQVITDLPTQHADNLRTMTTCRIQVSAWTTGLIMNLPDIRAAMEAGGFSWTSSRDLGYEMDSRRSGLAMDFYLTED